MINDLYKEDPRNIEDFDDLLLWRKSYEDIFSSALQLYFKQRIIKVSSGYLTECINDNNYSEISLVPDLFKRENFVDDSYEICGLFVQNKLLERFFILKKNNEFYGLDISKEYDYLINKSFINSGKQNFVDDLKYLENV